MMYNCKSRDCPNTAKWLIDEWTDNQLIQWNLCDKCAYYALSIISMREESSNVGRPTPLEAVSLETIVEVQYEYNV